MDDFFLIAEVKAILGTEGYVNIQSFSDFSERFFQLKEVYVDFFGNFKKFVVEDAISSGKNIALKFKGFNSADDAAIFLNKKVFVEKKNSVLLDENTFFIHDVIGSSVFRNSELIGTVDDVYVLPANDVYVIKTSEGRNILVPAVKDYVKGFNAIDRRLELVPDCDLLYDDEN